MARAFEYTPLDPADPQAFRLLELLPSARIEASIHCKLQNCSLSGDIEYEALSYAWGTDVPEFSIFVNDIGTVEVSRSCIDALRHMRHESRRRALWVDAICINQREDDASRRERNHQVKLMFEIYRKAQTVLVWLGLGEQSTAHTMAFLKLADKLMYWSPWYGRVARRISKKLRKFSLSELRASATRLLLRSMFQSRGTPKPQYDALAAIFHSPWWQRVWTLQEEVLADRCVVFHGRQSIDMRVLISRPLLKELSMMLGKHYELNHMARTRIRLLCVMIGMPSPDQDHERHAQFINHASGIVLENLFNMAFLLQSKNDVDKIYGFYSIMANYCDLPIPEPDYGKSCEVVYTETAWAWIDTRNDLSILKLAARRESFENLPSWAPAWCSEHPGFPRSVADSGNSFLGSLLTDPERHPFFNAAHFSWDYMSNDSLRMDSWNEVQQSGPILALLPSGQLHIFRTCRVGTITSAIGYDKPGDYWQRDKDSYLSLHIRWVQLAKSVYSATAFQDETALLEMFRSLDTPGIYGFEAGRSDFADRFKLFCAWAEFILSIDSADNGQNLSYTTDTDRNDPSARKAAVQIYASLANSRTSESINILQKHFVGKSKTRRELAHMAKAVFEMYRSLIRVRNHALCLLDSGNVLAVTNYRCEEGDEVFILPNTDPPFVLRKEPDRDVYRLVGPASIDRLCQTGYQEFRRSSDTLRDILVI